MIVSRQKMTGILSIAKHTKQNDVTNSRPCTYMTCMCTCIHMPINTQTCMCACAHTHTQTHIQTTDTHTHTHKQTHTHTHTHTHATSPMKHTLMSSIEWQFLQSSSSPEEWHIVEFVAWPKQPAMIKGCHEGKPFCRVPTVASVFEKSSDLNVSHSASFSHLTCKIVFTLSVRSWTCWSQLHSLPPDRQSRVSGLTAHLSGSCSL